MPDSSVPAKQCTAYGGRYDPFNGCPDPHRGGSGRPAGPVVAVLVTVVAWASAFVAIRAMRDSFDPGALALGRLLVGTVALGAALLVRHSWVRPTPRGRSWGKHLHFLAPLGGLLALVGISLTRRHP